MNPRSRPASAAFFGPWAVRAAFVIAIFGWGVGFYGPAIYLAEVIQRSQWSLGLVSLAVTLHFLFGALVVANLPRLYAAFGLPATTAAGSVLAALGIAGWALAAQPWQLFVAALGSGAGWVTMGAVAVNTIVAPWYQRGRPRALARAYNGASIGGVIFSPLWVALIGGFGFAMAAGIVGAAMVLVVAALAACVLTKSPQALGQVPDGDRATDAVEASREQSDRAPLPGPLLWRDRAFITLAAGMALGLFAQVGLLAHLFKLLVPALGAQNAGWLMGLGTACAIAGRHVAARAVQRFGNRRAVAAVGYAVQACGAAVLWAADAGQAGLMVLGVMLVGSGIGNATSIPPLIAQTDFAAQDVTRVVALIVAMAQGAYAFAPACFGFVQVAEWAQPQGAAVFFAAAIAVQLSAAAVFLAYRPPARRLLSGASG